MHTYERKFFIIAVSFILAFILTNLPLPDVANWLKPYWVTSTLIFWLILLPETISVSFVWFIGLLLDVNNTTPLGENALGLVLITYFITKFHTQIKLLPLEQQSLAIFGVISIYATTIALIQYWTNNQCVTIWIYIYKIAISTLLWFWLTTFFKYTRRAG
jgi:rod shape-determining protein MreD